MRGIFATKERPRESEREAVEGEEARQRNMLQPLSSLALDADKKKYSRILCDNLSYGASQIIDMEL